MNYAPLFIKTDYSLLSSLIKIDDLISYLKKYDINKVAVCDDNLFYAAEFYNKCILNDIKPIFGLEINLDYKVLLYAKNYKGYQVLCNIDTLKNEKKLTEEFILNNSNDLVVILPFEYMDKKDEYYKHTEDVFIGYINDEEKIKIDFKKVYIRKTLCLEKEDEKYLKYLYKIKDEEINLKDVYLEENINSEDKKTTLLISELCNVKLEKQEGLLPIYNKEASFDEFKYLTDLCIYGLKKRLNNNLTNKYIERLKYELKVINEMGFCNYFLVVWDYVKYAKKNNILVGPGRGSAASSLVSYSLGITDIDPLKYNLLFERFLNPERVTMPDIDIDFDALKRQEVIDYVINKYGKEKVSGIVTFSNLTAKQVIRDVAKIFDVSNFKIDSISKSIDEKKTLKENLDNINIKRLINNDEVLKEVYKVAMKLEGLKRHTSIHAAGIIISDKKLSNYVPLLLNSDGSYLCGYTMNYIEDLGFLKMDFLALKNLTVIDKVINGINDIKFNEIPLDDELTYKLFRDGNLDGVFQFESTGMKKFIMDLKPNNINDLIDAVALYRPGPMDNIDLYVKRKHNKLKVEYINKELEDILKSTNGIIIYQEQIMQIASKMAGFSYAEADLLRRAMSKKKESILLKQKENFINGSIKNGYSKEDSEKVYDMILKFANYGFNKAHSVSYAIVGYKIAYLKAHYPNIFMCEILNNAIGNTNKTKSLINECKRLGVEIIKPNINTSIYEYKIDDQKIEYSLSMIKNIGTLTCKNIVKERLDNGEFTSYLDMVKRLYKLGKDVLRSIILSGSASCFNLNKKTMMENLDDAINYAELCQDLDENFVIKPEIKICDEYDDNLLTKYEEDLFGFYINNHPVSRYITDNSITISKIEKYFDKYISIVLYFERKKDIDTKNNEKMMFITASDVDGVIELIMFPREYHKYFNIVVPGIYKVNAKVEKRFSKFQLIINNIEKINE